MRDRQASRSGTPASVFESPTFDRDVEICVDEPMSCASISPSGRDIVLASRNGLFVIDLDSPYDLRRHIPHSQPWNIADVQWSPFAARDYWVVSTSNQKALVWNLALSAPYGPIQHILHAHTRAITDINFSAHHPDVLATCAIDSLVYCWDLRQALKPVTRFADWDAGATQVKWSRQDPHIVASAHGKVLRIWDDRKGAVPLRSITAHSSSIYGIDWNRTKATSILTCGLDSTIKFWDYSDPEDKPERVIKTPFPVRRARHTPFGWGVMAMPQREDKGLYLYDRRLSPSMKRISRASPVASFQGHEAPPREFLWRSRGSIDNGVDNRDFQLVSWGSDCRLQLHRIEPSILQKVGHEKGMEAREIFPQTRQGAPYKTFRDEPPELDPYLPLARPLQSLVPLQGHLSTLLQTAGMTKSQVSTSSNVQLGAFSSYSNTMHGKHPIKRTVNPIDWMEGVKIGKRENGAFAKFGAKSTILPPDHQWVWDTPESLGDEITSVGQKFRKVSFEQVDVSRRAATVALNGPWGPGGKQAFVRINLKFPPDYPRESTPEYRIEKTTSAIADDLLPKLLGEIQSIAEHSRSRKRGCLEAIISYLLGERGLEESISWLSDEGMGPEFDPAPEESSSDEEDNGPDFNGTEGESKEAPRAGVTANANANMPLPKACGAMWAKDGRLVCFFPPKPEPKPLFSLDALHNADRLSRKHRIFETFGRLNAGSPARKNSSAIEDDGSSSSVDSWASSSSSSSVGLGAYGFSRGFQPPAAWRGSNLRFQQSSQHSSAGLAKQPEPPKPKSIISIHNMEKILPSKRKLAEEYTVYGDGPEVCAHNAAVARNHGYNDLADIWKLIELILSNNVPLKIMPQFYRRESILVLARRELVRIKRKDSGLDLQFDNEEAVARPRLRGRVKWGQHPFANRWLVPQLFDYFERLADTQMLAMLSCIFAEPAAKEGVSNAMMHLKQPEVPMSMKSPAFSLDYFPSQEIAWSLYKPMLSIPSTPTAALRNTSSTATSMSDRLDGRLDTYGSAGSSNGPWGSDPMLNEPVTLNSTGTTPPTLSRSSTIRSSATASFSTSPEQQHHPLRKSNSSLMAALRPFSITAASSPPSQPRARTNDGDLSTSAPTSTVTWGQTTFYGSGSTASVTSRGRHSKRNSIAQPSDFDLHEDEPYYDTEEGDDNSSSRHDDDDEESRFLPSHDSDSDFTIKITLKNQNKFDDEACLSLPLLPSGGHDWKHKAWREAYANQLTIWGLAIQRSEILKFNGLVPYWPDEPVEEYPIHKSMTLEPYPPVIPARDRNARDRSKERSGRQLINEMPINRFNFPSFVPSFASGLTSDTLTFATGSTFKSNLTPPSYAQSNSTTHSSSTAIAAPVATNPVKAPLLTTESRPPSPNLSIDKLGGELGSVERPVPASMSGGRKQGKGKKKCLCTVCWLSVHGLYVYCGKCLRVAHPECVAEVAEKGESEKGVEGFDDCAIVSDDWCTRPSIADDEDEGVASAGCPSSTSFMFSSAS